MNGSRDGVKYRQKHSKSRKAGNRRLGGEALYQSWVQLYHDWLDLCFWLDSRIDSTNLAGRLSQKDPVIC